MDQSVCPDVWELKNYLLGQLTQAAESNIEAHIARCAACERTLADSVSEISSQVGLQIDLNASSDDDSGTELQDLVDRLNQIGDLVHVQGRAGFSPGDESATLHPANRTHQIPAGESQPDQWATVPDSPLHPVPRHVGRFLLRQEIGRGGFGIVFQAFDSSLNRVVALKVARSIVPGDSDSYDRFLREAKAVARLTHPNIIPVFEAGEANGVWFLAMEYCEGTTLERWARQQPAVAWQTAVEIVRQLADGVAHAHRMGLVHRDIKPGNVMLDARQSGGRLPFFARLTDFGLARLVEDNVTLSVKGLLEGTPRYMAPEQVSGETRAIGPSTDVHALGVLLYELLTGEPPFQGANVPDTLRRVVVEVPRPPSLAQDSIPRDLDAICRRALEKRPDRRYADAGELFEDLTRLQSGSPTVARPLRWHEQLWRAVRQRPAAATVIALVCLFCVTAIIGLHLHQRQQAFFIRELTDKEARLTTLLGSSTVDRQQLIERNSELRHHAYVAGIKRAYDAWVSRDQRMLHEKLEQIRREQRGAVIDLRGLEWHYLQSLQRFEHQAVQVSEQSLYTVAYDRNQNQLITAGLDGQVYVMDAETLERVAVLDTRQGEVNQCSLTADGGRLLTSGDDGTVAIWSTRDWTKVARVDVLEGNLAYSVVPISGRDEFLVAGDYPHVERFDFDGRFLGDYRSHTKPVEQLVAAADGETFLSASSDRGLAIWRQDQAEPVRVFRHHTLRLTCVHTAREGRFVVSGSIDKSLIVSEAESGSVCSRRTHLDEVQCVAVVSSGRYVASGDRGGAVKLWRLRGDGVLLELDSWKAHAGRVYALKFLPGGRQLVSVGQDGRLCVWPVVSGKSSFVFDQPVKKTVLGSYIVPGTSWLATGYSDRIRLWDYEHESTVRTWEFAGHDWNQISAAADGRWWVAGSVDGTVAVWAFGDDRPRRQWDLKLAGGVADVAVSHDGSLVAVAVSGQSIPDRVRVYDVKTGERQDWFPPLAGYRVAFSPVNSLLAASEDGVNAVQVWDCDRREQVARFREHSSTIRVLAFSSDAQLLLTGARDRRIKLFDLARGKLVHSLEGHRNEITGLAFSSDGRSILSCDKTGVCNVWNTRLGEFLFRLHQGPSCLNVGISSGSRHVIIESQRDWTVLDLTDHAAQSNRTLRTGSKLIVSPAIHAARNSSDLP